LLLAVHRNNFSRLLDVYHPDAYDNHGVYATTSTGFSTGSPPGTRRSCSRSIPSALVSSSATAMSRLWRLTDRWVQHEKLDRTAFSDGCELLRRAVLGVRYFRQVRKAQPQLAHRSP
jgi:hypothetical protein